MTRGTQLNLYLLPSDLAELEAAWAKSVQFVVAEKFRSDGTPVRLENLQIAEMGRTPLRVYLLPPWLAERPAYFATEVLAADHIDPVSAPVVEFDRCFYDGHIIRRGRLYAVPSSIEVPGSERELEEFRGWLRSLYDVARRTVEKWKHGTFIGHHAREAAERGDVELRDI